MLNPTVSVIIPTYNRQAFIGAAVKSILDQSFQDFEIIVIDDGSLDHTKEVIAQFESCRVVYFYQPNLGRSNARNRALEMARGRYVAFLDSDDVYLPGKLKLQVDFLESNPCVGMVYTSAGCIDSEGNLLLDSYDASVSGWIYRDVAFFVPVTITLPTVMVRREVFDEVGQFDEALDRFEDTDMWRRISKCHQIFGLQDRTCLLRTHSGNALAGQDPLSITQALDRYVKKIGREDKDMGWFLRHRGVAKLYGYYGAALMTNQNWREIGRDLLLKEIYWWPFDARTTLRTLSLLLSQRLRTLLQSTSDGARL